MTSLAPLPSSERTGPGRPREFDLDDALRDAVEVFRVHGYHGTSVQDLTEGTGLARGSLYKAFHDKRTLFLAALDQTIAGSLRRIADQLATPGSAKDAIRETLTSYAQRAGSSDGRRGCIMTTAAIELMPEDTEVGIVIGRMFRTIEDLFAAAVIRGQAAGEIPAGHDPRAIGKHLLCTVQGFRVLGTAGLTDADAAAIIGQALRILS